MASDTPTFNWVEAESIDSFSTFGDNFSGGECGYDAPRRALEFIGFEVGDLKTYHSYLLDYVTSCKKDDSNKFLWYNGAGYSNETMYDKIESVSFGNGNQLKKAHMTG